MLDTQLDSFAALLCNLGKNQYRVLNAIIENNGATAFELVELLDMPINSISGRITELAKLGRIEDSGIRKLNPKTMRYGARWICNL